MIRSEQQEGGVHEIDDLAGDRRPHRDRRSAHALRYRCRHARIGTSTPTCFTPDAFIDYTSSGGIKGKLPEVKAWLAQIMPTFPMTQHLVANRVIAVQGDTATCRSYFFNPMGLPDDDQRPPPLLRGRLLQRQAGPHPRWLAHRRAHRGIGLQHPAPPDLAPASSRATAVQGSRGGRDALFVCRVDV